MSFDPRHVTRSPPIGKNVFEMGGIVSGTNKFLHTGSDAWS